MTTIYSQNNFNVVKDIDNSDPNNPKVIYVVYSPDGKVYDSFDNANEAVSLCKSLIKKEDNKPSRPSRSRP